MPMPISKIKHLLRNSSNQFLLRPQSLLLFFLFALLLTQSTHLVADEQYQELDSIEEAVKLFLGSNGSPQKLDPRLLLKKCHSKLSVTYPFNTKTTTQVRCADNNGWKIFVPIHIKENRASDPLSEIKNVRKNNIHHKESLPTNSVSKHKILRKNLLDLISNTIETNKFIDIDSSNILSRECKVPLVIEFPFKSKETLSITCKGNSKWTMYFSVFDTPKEPTHPNSTLDSKHKIDSNKLKVVAASKQIRRGIPLIKDDLNLISIPKTKFNTAHFTSIDMLIGMEPSQVIPRGTAITSNMVKPQTLVKRGEKVTIILEKSGLSVRNEGEALENGAYRQKINVFIPDTKQTIKGVVQSPGLIKIQ